MNTKFAETLDSLAIPHEFREYSGNHYDKLFDRFPISLQFLNSKMNVISGNEIYTSTIPKSVILYQNYPNPISAGGGSAYGGNSVSVIRFDLNKQSFVSLKIYNIQGKEIQILVNKNYFPGSYQVTFSARHLPSGLYIYHLNTDNYSEKRKLLLTK